APDDCHRAAPELHGAMEGAREAGAALSELELREGLGFGIEDLDCGDDLVVLVDAADDHDVPGRRNERGGMAAACHRRGNGLPRLAVVEEGVLLREKGAALLPNTAHHQHPAVTQADRPGEGAGLRKARSELERASPAVEDLYRVEDAVRGLAVLPHAGIAADDQDAVAEKRRGGVAGARMIHAGAGAV